MKVKVVTIIGILIVLVLVLMGGVYVEINESKGIGKSSNELSQNENNKIKNNVSKKENKTDSNDIKKDTDDEFDDESEIEKNSDNLDVVLSLEDEISNLERFKR